MQLVFLVYIISCHCEIYKRSSAVDEETQWSSAEIRSMICNLLIFHSSTFSCAIMRKAPSVLIFVTCHWEKMVKAVPKVTSYCVA